MEEKYAENLSDPDMGDFYTSLIDYIISAKKDIAELHRTRPTSDEL